MTSAARHTSDKSGDRRLSAVVLPIHARLCNTKTFLTGTTESSYPNTMKQSTKPKTYWAAVRVKRGYIRDVRLFDSFDAASRLVSRWRSRINPDYDEAAV